MYVYLSIEAGSSDECVSERVGVRRERGGVVRARERPRGVAGGVARRAPPRPARRAHLVPRQRAHHAARRAAQLLRGQQTAPSCRTHAALLSYCLIVIQPFTGQRPLLYYSC